jgi:hypothetical protein
VYTVRAVSAGVDFIAAKAAFNAYTLIADHSEKCIRSEDSMAPCINELPRRKRTGY